MALSGLLYSQIGYDHDQPKRVVVRSTEADFLGPDACVRLVSADGAEARRQALEPWGELWGSHWWVAELGGFQRCGQYAVEAISAGQAVLRDEGLRIGRDVLWEQTWRLCSIDMLQRRRRFAKAEHGWFDAGMLWQEANSHAATILGLCDMLSFRGGSIDAEARRAVEQQIASGCDYLAACQDQASELGFADGALSHDVIGHEREIIPGDMAKAAAAWARAANVLTGDLAGRAEAYRRRAVRALRWFETARPIGNRGFSPRAHGVAEGYVVPEAWRSEDLLMRCWAACELTAGCGEDLREHAAELARQLRARQIPENEAEDGLWGHFRTFGDAGGPTQKAWTHCIYDNTFGTDVGASFPWFVLPLLQMHRAWPDHPEAGLWRDMAEATALGFLLPACRRSPFLIAPLGVFGDEGLLWFAGLWHGMNAVYGLTAAQALEFEDAFSEPGFREIATGNLQWIAGLNAGLTAEGLSACHVFSMDVPEDRALPVSMICHVGRRWAGSWVHTRGSICNGFCTGDQFTFDVPPTGAADGPHTLTDEDWITHAGAWLTGTARLGG